MILRLVWIEFPGETLGSGRFGKGVAVVTQSKDLRTGHSVWQRHRAPPAPHRRLNRDLKTDVLVIGAGITGAMGVNLKTEADHRMHALLQSDRAMMDWIAVPNFLDAYK